VLFALSACGRQVASYLEDDASLLYEYISTDNEPASQLSKVWQGLYAELLRAYATLPMPDYLEHHSRSFILYDINKDGIPELIITHINAGIFAESVYTVISGEIVALELRDSFFAYFVISGRPDNQQGIILFAYGDVSLMQIDETSMFREIHLRAPFFQEDYGWYINGVEATEDEHKEMLDFIVDGRDIYTSDFHYLYHLWPHEITEANIQTFVFQR